MIRRFFSSAALLFGIGLAAWLSQEIFIWAELTGVPHGSFVLYGLAGWLLRYGLFLTGLSVFRSVAIPGPESPLPDLRRIAGVLFSALMIASAVFFLQFRFGNRVAAMEKLQGRYRSHSVVRQFRTGFFFRGGGFLFRPGVTNSSGYSRSLLVYSHSGTNNIFMDTSVEVGEKLLRLQGGWRAGETLETNGASLFPLRREALFTPPSYPLVLAGVDVGEVSRRIFSWRIAVSPMPVLMEAMLFTFGLFLLMAGGGLFVRRRDMPVGSRFIAQLLAVGIAAGPVFLFQYLQQTALQRGCSPAVGLLFRGGGILVVGLAMFLLGWRRYRRMLPPDVRASL